MQRKTQGLGLDTSRSFYWEKEIMVGRKAVLRKVKTENALGNVFILQITEWLFRISFVILTLGIPYPDIVAQDFLL